MFDNFACFLNVFLFFFQMNIFINKFQEYTQVSNILNPEQARQHVGPVLDANCLQRLLAHGTCRQ